jgi:hypothetical protein
MNLIFTLIFVDYVFSISVDTYCNLMYYCEGDGCCFWENGCFSKGECNTSLKYDCIYENEKKTCTNTKCCEWSDEYYYCYPKEKCDDNSFFFFFYFKYILCNS